MSKRKSKGRSDWICGLAAAAVLGCTGRDAPPPAVTATPHDTLAADITIGGIDDERPEYEFGRIYGLIGTRAGGVVVADGMNDVVRVFDASGTHRFSFGRRGAGPGELRGPCCLAYDRDGRLWVRDGGNARYNIYRLFDDSAHYIRQQRMVHSDVNRVAPLTFDESGHVIDIGGRSVNDAIVTVRFHTDSSSTVVREEVLHEPPQDSTSMKTVERRLPDGFARMFAYQPYGPSPLAAHGPNGEFAHALNARYAIDWRDAHGDLLRHLTHALAQGPPLSVREHAAAQEQLEQQAKRLNVPVAQLGFGIPTHKPPLRALFFDREGRLWVELSVADGADRTAHVYDSSGRLERTVTWPRRINLTHGAVYDDVAWGVAIDSLEVPSIVRLRGFATRR